MKKEINRLAQDFLSDYVKTNKISCFLVFTKASNDEYSPIDEKHLRIQITDLSKAWKSHPDPDVDLCAMPIASITNIFELQSQKIFFIPLSIRLIPSSGDIENLGAVEDIIMVGYPNGIWDEVNNQPIFRKGITATHPAKNYMGKKEFVIDAACFPGSSGSPVFIYNPNGYFDREGNYFLGQPRLLLLGVLYAGPQHTVQGQIRVIDAKLDHVPISLSLIPNNLGYVIKSERIQEFEKLFMEAEGNP